MTFQSTLLALLGDGTRDISLPLVPLFEYQFLSLTVLLWPGAAVLKTVDGRKWLGTVDEHGVDHHTIEPVSDGRDGSAEQYDLQFPYLDEATYLTLRAGGEAVSKRRINIYVAAVLEGEGLNPKAPVLFFTRLLMQTAIFGDHTEEQLLGGAVRNRSLTIRAKNHNAGQSFAARRTYTDASQQQYARDLGIVRDDSMGFVNAIANETVVRP